MRGCRTLTAGLALFLLCGRDVKAGAKYDGAGTVIVSGMENTLASIAADIGKPDVFSYDAKTRTADCKASISFEGSRWVDAKLTEGARLTIGKKDDPQAGETLRIVCDPEGEPSSRRIFADNATLNIYHSKIVGVNSRIGGGKYRFHGVQYYSRGTGEILHAQIHGARTGLSVASRAPAGAVVKDLKCADCAIGLSWTTGKGNCLQVDGLDVSEDVKYGVYFTFSPSRTSPATVRNAALGNAMVVMNTQSRKFAKGTALFVNAVVKPNRVWFQKGFGESKVVSGWEQYVQMTDFDTKPLPDGKLLLKSTMPDGQEALPPETTLVNGAGEAWAFLPVSVITEVEGKQKEDPVTSQLSASSADTPFKTVRDAWKEPERGGWRLERMSDGSWNGVSVSYKAPKDLQRQILENLCANGGFEVETSPGYPDCWATRGFIERKPGGWGILGRSGYVEGAEDQEPQALVRWGLDREVFYEGKKSMTMPPMAIMHYWPPPGIGIKELLKGKTYTVSFYARTDKPGTRIWVWRWMVIKSQEGFTLTDKWERYSVTWRDLPGNALLFFRNMPQFYDSTEEELAAQGQLWLDAVQIEVGDKLHPFMPSGYVCPEH